MRARGDLRHDAAEGRVIRGLAEHDIGQDASAPVGLVPDDCRGRLVAARLDAEHREGARGGASLRSGGPGASGFDYRTPQAGWLLTSGARMAQPGPILAERRRKTGDAADRDPPGARRDAHCAGADPARSRGDPFADARYRDRTGMQRFPTRSYQAVLVTSSNAVRALAARPVRPVSGRGAALRGRRSDGAPGKALRLSAARLCGRRRSTILSTLVGGGTLAGGGSAPLRGGGGAGRRSRRTLWKRRLRSRPSCFTARSRGPRLANVAEAALKARERWMACSSIRDEALRPSRWRFAPAGSRRLPAPSRASASRPRRRRPSRKCGAGPDSRRGHPDQLSLFAMIEAEEAARRDG